MPPGAKQLQKKVASPQTQHACFFDLERCEQFPPDPLLRQVRHAMCLHYFLMVFLALPYGNLTAVAPSLKTVAVCGLS